MFAVGGPSEGCCNGTGQARVKAGKQTVVSRTSARRQIMKRRAQRGGD